MPSRPSSVARRTGRRRIGDAQAALDSAAHRIDSTYRTPRHNHCAIEPHAVTVSWQDGRLTVHDGSQMVHLTRSTLADVFGIPDEKVHVLSPFVGGGFGNKAVWNTTSWPPPPPAWPNGRCGWP